MLSQPDNLTPLAAAPDLVRRFRLIFSALLPVVARLFVRHPVYAALGPKLWNYWTRTARRLELALARSGPPPARESQAGRERGERKARLRLPGRKGWLVREFGWEVTVFGARLRDLLEDPAMLVALARPDIARILRPVCTMLMFELPAPLAKGKVRVVKPLAVATLPVWPSESRREVAQARADAVERAVGFAKIR